MRVHDVFGRPIRIGDTVLYAGYSSARLSTAVVTALRERDGRPEIVVRTERGAVTVLHHPRRIYVLPGKQAHAVRVCEDAHRRGDRVCSPTSAVLGALLRDPHRGTFNERNDLR